MMALAHLTGRPEAVEDSTGNGQSLLDNDHAVELARRDNVAAPIMWMVRPAPDPGQVLRRHVQSPPTLGVRLGGTQREDVISPFVLGRRRVDVDRDAFDRMAGLVLDDAADRGARLEPQLLHRPAISADAARSSQRMWIGTSFGIGSGEPQDMDRRLRGPFDHRRAVLSGRDGRLLNLLAQTHPIFDGHSLDRFIGLRRDGAERQFPGRFLVRGLGGAAGLGCREPACSARVKPKPPMSTRITPPTRSAGMTRLQDSAVRKTFRFKASRRRRTSEVRAMASPWAGSGPAARTASRARVRPYDATSPSMSAATASQTASHADACAARIRQASGWNQSRIEARLAARFQARS